MKGGGWRVKETEGKEGEVHSISRVHPSDEGVKELKEEVRTEGRVSVATKEDPEGSQSAKSEEVRMGEGRERQTSRFLLGWGRKGVKVEMKEDRRPLRTGQKKPSF